MALFVRGYLSVLDQDWIGGLYGRSMLGDTARPDMDVFLKNFSLATYRGYALIEYDEQKAKAAEERLRLIRAPYNPLHHHMPKGVWSAGLDVRENAEAILEVGKPVGFLSIQRCLDGLVHIRDLCVAQSRWRYARFLLQYLRQDAACLYTVDWLRVELTGWQRESKPLFDALGFETESEQDDVIQLRHRGFLPC